MSFLDFLFGTARYHSSTVITDVTRMRDGRVCIAALKGTRQIRLASPQPTEEWLESVGGLTPGTVVKLDWHPSAMSIRPHVEDGEWKPETFRKVIASDCPNLEDRLETRKSVTAAFGEPLYFAAKGNPAFSPGNGTRSLATILVKQLRVYRSGERIRADFEDAKRTWKMVPVEDLRLWRHARSCSECRGRTFQDHLASEMSGKGVLIRIGLGRPFRPEHRPLGCFLQLNTVVWSADAPRHLFSDPIPTDVTALALSEG